MCLGHGIAAYGIPTVALRFFNVYGPGQALSNPYTGVAAIFASRLLNGRPPVIFEDGEQSRDFTHVSDIVRGIQLALESDRADGTAMNLGTGHPPAWPRWPGSWPRVWTWTSRRSATSNTARATSATASPIPLGPTICSALRRGRPSRTAWPSSSPGSGPGSRRPRGPGNLGVGRARPHPLRALMTQNGNRRRSRDHHRLDQRGALARALPANDLRPRGRCQPRRRRGRQRLERTARRELVESRVPASARSCDSREPRLRPREQPGRDHGRQPATCSSSTRTPRSLMAPSASWCELWTPVLRSGLAGVRQITADGTLWPTIRYFPGLTRRSVRPLARSAGRCGPRWAGERELDLSALRARNRVRLDLRLLHARPSRSAAQRRTAWTSVSSSTPRSPICACG